MEALKSNCYDLRRAYNAEEESLLIRAVLAS
jgi:hypothetical protein